VWEAACLKLTITDDGQGFVPSFVPEGLTAYGHFGLVGMQERVDLIGGRLQLQSAIGEGTKVGVVWPS
jgi:two-component system sensor histidine kinase DegS